MVVGGGLLFNRTLQYLQSGKAVGRLLGKLPEFKHVLQSLFGHVIFSITWPDNVSIGMRVTNTTGF